MAGGKRFVLQFQGDKLILNADSTIPEAGGLADPLTPEYSFTLEGRRREHKNEDVLGKISLSASKEMFSCFLRNPAGRLKNHDRKTQEVKMSFSQEVQGTLVSSARARQSRMKAIFS